MESRKVTRSTPRCGLRATHATGRKAEEDTLPNHAFPRVEENREIDEQPALRDTCPCGPSGGDCEPQWKQWCPGFLLVARRAHEARRQFYRSVRVHRPASANAHAGVPSSGCGY